MVTESERLVQRFLDQELSADERVQFVVRLGRDEALRQQVIALEQLLLGVSRLPRPAVPDGFVASVMARTATPASRAPAPAAWRKLTDALFAPHALQWNLASAVAMACLVLLVVGGVVLRGPSLPPASTTAGITSTTGTPSPVLVRLVVLQPSARMVQVAGDFNGWNPARTPLEEVASGSWAVTIPLQPGRYEYMLVVDGEWIADPFAAEQSDDGFGSRNAVLDVRPSVEAQS